ncbi:MAG: cob(I)yrinic acid a,c-diamide adenosyltransferase [Deinococcota bacterium]|jgi:cob(I)alamin adenosyltransferase|nr:cob(I)yrinic acid a,c-diamide adenosyltransferase [Deinococcota bacterium]
MKIYTKTGDDGTTALYGGSRVAKDALRLEAYGTVDEANAALGLARAQLGGLAGGEGLDALLDRLQSALFDLGADLATPQDSSYGKNIDRVREGDVALLEGQIDRFETELEPLRHFILPGGHPAAAALHLARTVARRAERATVRLAREEVVNPQATVYLNRLSDLLFVLARLANRRAGVADEPWQKRAERDGGRR